MKDDKLSAINEQISSELEKIDKEEDWKYINNQKHITNTGNLEKGKTKN